MDKLYAPAVRLNHVRSGRGEPLVLLHGIGDTHEAWTPVRERLAAHHEVIAVDLPGFGRSRALRSEAPTPAALARAVIDFMGGERFHVAGNSLGGGIALEVGRSGHALSVTGLSPIGFVRGWERAWARFVLQSARTLAPRLRLRLGPTPVTWMLMDRPRPREVLLRGFDHLRHAPGWDRTLPLTLDYAFAGTIDVPVTIAWGEHDKLLLPRQAKRAQAGLPDATHVTLRNCGHLPAWDDPEQVTAAILSATTRSPRPRAPAAA